MGIFSDVKYSVTAKDAARFYGIKMDPYGMARCPFHHDRRPSMKLDRRFHCFGCGADGDAIDLTAELFGLTTLDAAKKLIQDFGLPIDTGYRDLRALSPQRSEYLEKIEEEQNFRKWINNSIGVLIDYRNILEEWMKSKAPESPEDEWTAEFTEAGQMLPYVEYLLDQLLLGDEDARIDFYRNGRKEVERYAKRVREIRTAEHDGIECGADAGPDREGSNQTEHSEHGHSS